MQPSRRSSTECSPRARPRARRGQPGRGGAGGVEEGEPPPRADALQTDARTLFEQLDTDKSGFLDKAEVAQLCKKMGRQQSEATLAAAFAEIDTNKNGKVDWSEFSVWWTWTAQHEEEVGLGHSPEDYPNHAFWARQSPQRTPGGSALSAQQMQALQLAEEEDLLAAGDATPPSSGSLRVEVVSCSGLLSADRGGASDPYVTLRLGGGESLKSKVQKKTLSPVFNELFRFGIRAADDSPDAYRLHLEVSDWSRSPGQDSFLGDVVVNLAEAFAGNWSATPVGPLEFELGDANGRLDAKIAKQVGTRRADGEWQQHGRVALKLSFV